MKDSKAPSFEELARQLGCDERDDVWEGKIKRMIKNNRTNSDKIIKKDDSRR